MHVNSPRFAHVCILLAAAWAIAASSAAERPRRRPEDRPATAGEAAALARSWPAEGPRVLWKFPVRKPLRGPVIHGDSVLVLNREGPARDVLRRIRLADGEEVWRFPYHASEKREHEGSRATPVTDGEHVLAVGPAGRVHGVSFADGARVFEIGLLGTEEPARPVEGVPQSSLLLGDRAIVAPWRNMSAIAGVDRATGEVVWTLPHRGGAAWGYSSLAPMTAGGRSMIVACGRGGEAVGIDPVKGEQLWSYAGYGSDARAPTPTIAEGGRVLLTGGDRGGAAMFRVESADGRFRTVELWKDADVAGPGAEAAIHAGHVYINSSKGGRGLCCVTLEGEVKWQTGASPRFDAGSLLLADGTILAIDSATGQLVMAEAGPEGYKELGRAAVLPDEAVRGPMACAGGRLVLLGRDSLVCLDLTGAAAPGPKEEFKQWLDRCQQSYDGLKDYTCLFVQRERVGGELMPEERARFKFKKPHMVYMKWVGKVNKGQECLYVKGRYDDKVVAKGSGLAGLVTLKLDPAGGTAMRGKRHPITEAGVGHLLDLLRKDYELAARHGEGRVIDKGEDSLSGRRLRVFECIMPADQRPQYYCQRAVVAFDTELLLPVRIFIYDARDTLLEQYRYEDLKPDVGLTERDFDEDNPDYGF